VSDALGRSGLLRKRLEDVKTKVDETLGRLIEEYPCPVSSLKEAMIYACAGGKRLRGFVLLSAYEAGGGNLDDALPFAVAIEMIHAYSLVHDDLPSMDNDDFRRGKPTCHKRFGEAVALLCGDALLTLAFEVMLSSRAQRPSRVLAAAREIAKAAGTMGLVGGQVLDLELEGKRGGQELVSAMYRMKTGALFRAAAVAGFRLAGASWRYVKAASNWGELFGYAYQVIDDLEDLGKTEKERTKDTLVRETSLKKAYEEARLALKGSAESLSALGPEVSFMREMSLEYLQKLDAMSAIAAIE